MKVQTTENADSLPFDIVLRDGSTLALRPASARDVPELCAFFVEKLSPTSRYYRFFSAACPDTESVERLIPKAKEGAALVGEVGNRVVAFAGYYQDPIDRTRAEVAFAIADRLHGRGIGTRVLERLADLARPAGVRVFEAYVLPSNHKMMECFLDSGYRTSRHVDNDVIHVELSLEPTLDHFERAAQRSQVAAAASMKPFFEPRAVAVIGANRQRGKIGAEILHNLQASGFTGKVIPVHASADDIQGLRAYRRVIDIRGPVDLAIIAVPSSCVLDAVDDCLAKGVRALCIISAGFGETGGEGLNNELILLDKVRSAGCRVIGPNCMGLLNTDPSVRLNATFSPVYPPAGGVAMSTQSGALGLAILDYARRLNIGISSFVSVGNKVDVSGNDLIQYWADDPRTTVILLYLESFGNPKKFGEIARRVGRMKPIVAVKAGRSKAGARAGSSHTGALATDDTVVDALFHQAGTIRTDTLEELFDVASLLANQPLPRGRRVAILTNAGGPGILAADACEAHGLDVAALAEQTRTELRTFLPHAASVANPVDMLGSAPAEHYRRALSALLRDENVDSVLTIFIPPLVTEPDAVAAAVVEAASEVKGKPVAGIFMRSAGAPPNLLGIPCYAFPESAGNALARVAASSEWKRKPVGIVPVLERFHRSDATRIVSVALGRGGGWLTPEETQALMEAIGVQSATMRLVRNADDAVIAAASVGFPVALKAIGPAMLHKTERQAVRLDLADANAVRNAAEDFEQRFRGELAGLLVQRMVPGGIEMLVGAVYDTTFGPLIACGTGGVLVDVLKDTVFRLHPITSEDAIDMINELKGVRLLRGYRGAPPVDEKALRDVVLRVSALLTECPEIHELDLNPVKVLPSGACALDARVRVERHAPTRRTRRVEY
jgi:acetate---CoA ligase (ADP-forming)